MNQTMENFLSGCSLSLQDYKYIVYYDTDAQNLWYSEQKHSIRARHNLTTGTLAAHSHTFEQVRLDACQTYMFVVQVVEPARGPPSQLLPLVTDGGKSMCHFPARTLFCLSGHGLRPGAHHQLFCLWSRQMFPFCAQLVSPAESSAATSVKEFRRIQHCYCQPLSPSSSSSSSSGLDKAMFWYDETRHAENVPCGIGHPICLCHSLLLVIWPSTWTHLSRALHWYQNGCQKAGSCL